jgi:glycosyltransferase involved in cell wall biosynthesis
VTHPVKRSVVSDVTAATDAASADGTTGSPGRAVILVGNPAAPYSRALRLARTLAREGYRVEIAAVAAPQLPNREIGDGWELRRYAPSGPWERFARSGSSRAGRAARPRVATTPSGIRQTILRAGRLAAAVRRWLFWPHLVRGWWATLARELPPADLYHACGSLTIAAALAARRRAPTGTTGHPARVIYDAIDDVMESNNVLDMPGPLRAFHERRETGWARASDGLTTISEPFAGRLGARWARRLVVVPNYPEITPLVTPAEPGTVGPLRRELGFTRERPIVLYQGRLGPRRGLDEAAEAVLDVPGAALVFLGFGSGFDRERARDAESRYTGRHFTLPARPPDELLAWVADADVVVIPLPPVSVNQRLVSPNKLWEAVAAGTPLVVPASISFMAELIRTEDLGVVVPSASPTDLAAGIRDVLDRMAADPGWRDRIRTIAVDRYTWPIAERPYLDLVRRLRSGPAR